MRLIAAFAALAALPSALAVFADEAYQIDYHHALLGLPQEQTTLFHQPRPETKASLIYTLSEQAVLGAINPKNGELVWRQDLRRIHPDGRGALLRAADKSDVVFSALANEIAAWSASDGRLVWSRTFDTGVSVKDLELVETEGAPDLLVLVDGARPTMLRLQGETGEPKWQWEDVSGDAPFQVSISASNAYYLSLHSTVVGNLNLKVATIDTVTGQKTDHQSIADSEVASADDVIFTGSAATPIVAWTNKGNTALKVNVLGTKSVSTFALDKAVKHVAIRAPQRVNSLPHFLVQYHSDDSHWAEVYHIDLKKTSISKAYDLPKLAGGGAFAVSTSDANVFFTRVAKGALMVVSSASHGIIERYMLNDFGVPALVDHPSPVQAISEVLPRAGTRHAVRAAVLLASGDWVLILNGEPSWSRPEALALTAAATFAELPQKEGLARELEIEEHATVVAAYVHRLKRHVRDLQKLPAFLSSLPASMLASLSGRAAATGAKTDSFGFHKFLVAATKNGRLIGLDAANGGAIVWNAPLVNYRADETPSLALRASPAGVVRVKGRGFHAVFDTSTGKFLRSGTDAASSTSGNATVVKFALQDGAVVGRLNGQSDALWTFAPADGERVVGISPRPAVDPVASIGKVLGDRRVLYKYLNPNAVLVTAVSDAARTATLYLLDGVSGSVLYAAAHAGVDTTQTIASTISENWFAYSFTTLAGPTSPSQGYQLAFAELYESDMPNDRGPLGASANYSSLQAAPGATVPRKPHVETRAYVVPEAISRLAVTHTRQGITSRLLLAVLPDSQAVAGIPLGAIDARRPIGREASAQEAAEGLVKYAPLVDIDGRWYLNHAREVLVDDIVTAPAVIESTSLVAAYGIDVFGTRVTPSGSFDVLGQEFNKGQMIMTVAALAVGVLVVGPLVRRKQIDMRWQLVT
ncbi:DUF1620-domain-containing protein [Trichodelitschia bisporula]|uniref:ER membrane protein complex subunit 1 n=1 Tax=Trichodelitschia bisporula TaxID=703511 RepID=A0A6G1HQ40_9PEZI|nr:DUF1620-domain-containing protein [Trichodelitschia bisporula]